MFEKRVWDTVLFLMMNEKLRKIRDNNENFAAVLTDLSKAFNCILHELLIAKLMHANLI